MRLLVLDHSGILPWLVEHLELPDVELEVASSLADAERAVRDHAPAAVAVSVPPGTLPWRSFQHLCASRGVPVLYESCVHHGTAEVGVDPGDGTALFLRKPAPRGALRGALEALLAHAAALAPQPH